MSFFPFLSWFRPWWKTSETDYESVLSRLSKDISTVQTRLVRIAQRERRASVTLTFYAFLLWIFYAVGLWYWSADKRLDMTKSERLHLWAPVIFGLLFIVSTRYLVRWWYRRIAEGEERHLRSLQRARRKKIDEIKQATKYDHLRNLLDKYDDAAPKSPERKVTAAGDKSNGRGDKFKNAEKGQRPSAVQQDQLAPPAPGHRSAQAPQSAQFSGKGAVDGRPIEAALPSQKQEQFQRTWLDRVADKILGAEGANPATAAEQRYALICRICFTHNGLCPKEDWEEVQYICPRCGTFNSRRPSSAPVSSPWRIGTSVPPSPASVLSKLPDIGQTAEKEDDSLVTEDADESLQNTPSMGERKPESLRPRRSTAASKAEESLENMEVD